MSLFKENWIDTKDEDYHKDSMIECIEALNNNKFGILPDDTTHEQNKTIQRKITLYQIISCAIIIVLIVYFTFK